MAVRRRKRRPHAQSDERAGPRPIWSGTISFGLVTVPVNLFPAVRAHGTSLRLLAPDGTPVQRRYVCPEDGKDVPWEELVRGYQTGADRYVVLSDQELEAAAPRRSRDIDLRRFVPAEQLDPFLFERAYLLAPDADSDKPYRLLAEVMESEGKAGIATFVLRTKEYLVAILAHDGILWAETMRFHGELRTPKDVGLAPLPHADKAAVARFTRAIHALDETAIDREELADRQQARLQKLVASKQRRGIRLLEPEVTPAPEDGAETPDLFEALRHSLQQHRKPRRRA
jgi:DNA end-binding protein Ku